MTRTSTSLSSRASSLRRGPSSSSRYRRPHKRMKWPSTLAATLLDRKRVPISTAGGAAYQSIVSINDERGGSKKCVCGGNSHTCSIDFVFDSSFE